MRTTFDINFYCRSSKTNKKGLAHIELSICINSQRLFLNLPLQVPPAEFNSKKQPQYIKDYLATMRMKINQTVLDMTNANMHITASTLRNQIKSGGVKPYTINDLITEFLSIQEKRIGIDLTTEHYQKYERTVNRFYQYVDKDSALDVITPALINRIYADWKRIYKPGTLCGYMTRLKTICKFGQDNNRITINPFQGIKIQRPSQEIEMITEEELHRIISHKYVSQRVEKVADLFIFGCGSGLAYCDMMKLTPEDFVEQNGQICIISTRGKTGVPYCSVLLPWAVDIAKKYNYQLPKLTNQKYNQSLKDIQDTCYITSVTSLHSHLARHFYCNYLLNKGVRLETVAKAAGHSTTKTTLKYYASVSAQTAINEIRRIM